MKKNKIIAVMLAVLLSSSVVLATENNYIAKAAEKLTIAANSQVSPEEKYASKIKDILSKRNEAIGKNQRITTVEEMKINNSFTVLLVRVIRSNDIYNEDEYIIDISGAGKVLFKDSVNKNLSILRNQQYPTINTSGLFYEYCKGSKVTINVLKVTTKKTIEKYEYNDLYDMYYVPQVMIDKSGNYIFYNDGFSNGAEGGLGSALVAQIDAKTKKLKTKYKFSSNNYVLDKNKNLWVLDWATKDKKNIAYTISSVVNGKKTVKYNVKYKNAESSLPMNWVNIRLKVVTDKEVYIQYPGSNKWTRVK